MTSSSHLSSHSAVDLGALVKGDVPRIIAATNAYYAAVEDVQLIAEEFDRWRSWGRKHDDRHHVFCIWPVSFWDAKLCGTAFSLAPKDVVARLAGHVEQAVLLSDGVYIIGRRTQMTSREVKVFDRRVRALLSNQR